MPPLCRSVLYIPASKARALEKAAELAADALILDLEDAVAPEEKAFARGLLADSLRQINFGARLRIVRINGLETAWGRLDAMQFGAMSEVDALLVPKVERPQDLDAVAALAPDKPLWAMMETARGLLAAQQIAAHPQVQGMVMGTNDLARELGLRFRADRLGLVAGLGQCLLAAKAQGKIIIDGVYNAFRDEDGLLREAIDGRDMGFDGKTLIHPTQIAVANRVFAPSAEDVDLARRQIAALAEARTRGEGIAVVDGRIVETLHVAMAEVTLARAGAIAGRAIEERAV